MTFKWSVLPGFAGLFEIAGNGVQSIPFEIRFFAELLLRAGAPEFPSGCGFCVPPPGAVAQFPPPAHPSHPQHLQLNRNRSPAGTGGLPRVATSLAVLGRPGRASIQKQRNCSPGCTKRSNATV